VGFEASTLIIPGVDQARRDWVGGGLVLNLSNVIQNEGAAHSVDPNLIGAVIRHESAAFERRVLTPSPIIRPGLIANAGELAQSALQGDRASIGPGQMQLGLARDLEAWGYVTARSNDAQRRAALLGKATSVEYVAGYLEYLSDELQAMPGFSELDVDTQNRLILIGYNWGREGLGGLIETNDFEGTVGMVTYDNQTCDEYERWRNGQ